MALLYMRDAVFTMCFCRQIEFTQCVHKSKCFPWDFGKQGGNHHSRLSTSWIRVLYNDCGGVACGLLAPSSHKSQCHAFTLLVLCSSSIEARKVWYNKATEAELRAHLHIKQFAGEWSSFVLHRLSYTTANQEDTFADFKSTSNDSESGILIWPTMTFFQDKTETITDGINISLRNRKSEVTQLHFA